MVASEADVAQSAAAVPEDGGRDVAADAAANWAAAAAVVAGAAGSAAADAFHIKKATRDIAPISLYLTTAAI